MIISGCAGGIALLFCICVFFVTAKKKPAVGVKKVQKVCRSVYVVPLGYYEPYSSKEQEEKEAEDVNAQCDSSCTSSSRK